MCACIICVYEFSTSDKWQNWLNSQHPDIINVYFTNDRKRTQNNNNNNNKNAAKIHEKRITCLYELNEKKQPDKRIKTKMNSKGNEKIATAQIKICDCERASERARAVQNE